MPIRNMRLRFHDALPSRTHDLSRQQNAFMPLEHDCWAPDGFLESPPSHFGAEVWQTSSLLPGTQQYQDLSGSHRAQIAGALHVYDICGHNWLVAFGHWKLVNSAEAVDAPSRAIEIKEATPRAMVVERIFRDRRDVWSCQMSTAGRD